MGAVIDFDAEIESIFNQNRDGWDTYKKHPKAGAVTLSRVGFNDERTEALLYVYRAQSESNKLQSQGRY